MTFCSEEQNKSEIITKVEYNKNYYILHYLDGNIVSFINNDENYLNKLEESIINQAKNRNKNQYTNININKWSYLIMSIINVNITNACIQKNLLNMACIGFIISAYLLINYRKNSQRIKELKKYKILLDNYKEFKENSNISKLIVVDALYRKPVNIFTVDEFSLSDMKIMKKGLKNKEY